MNGNGDQLRGRSSGVYSIGRGSNSVSFKRDFDRADAPTGIGALDPSGHPWRSTAAPHPSSRADAAPAARQRRPGTQPRIRLRWGAGVHDDAAHTANACDALPREIPLHPGERAPHGYVAAPALTRRARCAAHGCRPRIGSGAGSGPTRALTGTRGAGMTMRCAPRAHHVYEGARLVPGINEA
jgi:hypothetical protein